MGKVKGIIRVIHLIPHDGIGGVESAARTLNFINKKNLHFFVKYIYKPKDKKINYHLYSPFPIIYAAFQCVKTPPDFLIASLWRSCIVALIVKIFRWNTKVILFLHMASDAHFIDKILTRLTAKISYEIWGDSSRTLEFRQVGFQSKQTEVISFITKHEKPVNRDRPSLNFIFWGRIHRRKRLDKAIDLINQLYLKGLRPTFSIVGPDEGELKTLKVLVAKYSLDSIVQFHDPKDFIEIRELAADYSFFLQLSEDEGMGMSVVEAMQLGLVPIVTSVGEISNYCAHMKNAIIFDDQRQNNIPPLVCELINDYNLYSKIRLSAISTWYKGISYRESMLQALDRISGDSY